MSIPEKSRKAVMARSDGRCEICGDQGTNTHHRRPRGMGGSKNPDTNLPANLLRVCGSGNVSGCHGWLESHRHAAFDLGHLVHQGHDPSRVPVWLHGRGFVLLDNRGGAQQCDPPQTGVAS